MKKAFLLALLLIVPILLFPYGASWNQTIESDTVNPRINIVHVDSTNDSSFYNFLSAIPMAYFHNGGYTYSSLLITDDISDTTVGYLIDDWSTYLDSHNGLERHANYIGDVSSLVISNVNSTFGISSSDNYDTIKGTPDKISVEIAKKDWSYSHFAVIAPFISPIDDNIAISIANAAAIASMHNAPVIYTEPDSLSDEAKITITSLGVDSVIILDVGNNLSSTVNTQLSSMGISYVNSLTDAPSIVSYIRNLAGRSNLCAVINKNQILPAALAAARYKGYVLFLPDNVKKIANDFKKKILADRELHSFYKLTEIPSGKEYVRAGEDTIATNFYNWLSTMNGDDPNHLETVITFEPQGTGGGNLETTFERAISGDPSNLTRKGAITGRMPLNWIRNIALENRSVMYDALIFANPRPAHITEAMNAYEVQHAVDQGSPVPDAWGQNHIINEIFGWPSAGWTSTDSFFPWDAIHTNPPTLSPILPPGPGDGAGYDPGQFSSFLAKGYDVVFHSGAHAGSGQHPAQPSVDNIGFVNDVNNGSAFLYFSCHGGGTLIAVRDIDNGIAQDSDGETWGAAYWPDDDGRTYDGSSGGDYTQSDLNNDLTNTHSMMIGYNACEMANGYMNEILLIHGGVMSIGSYTSVSFTGSGWWWNVWVHLVTHEGYTVGEAAAYATARVADLYVPTKDRASDNTLQYVVYGDPNTQFVQTDWTNPSPAPIKTDYNGHVPDKPANQTLGTLVPDSINVSVDTTVTVTLKDSVGNPIDSGFVTISGYGVNLSDSTDASGEAVFTFAPPYGENLLVKGTIHNFATYIDTLYVINANDFTGITVSASCPSVGLTDTLALGVSGTIIIHADQSNYSVKISNCGLDTTVNITASDDTLTNVVPTSTGNIQLVFLKDGYNIHSEQIPVVEAYGTLSGKVLDTSSVAISGASVKGYPLGSDTSVTTATFNLTSNDTGYYSVPDSILCGSYDVYASKFGYLAKHDTVNVLYGANTHNITITPAPMGKLTGIVSDTSGTPLNASISLYRSDNGTLYKSTTSDSVNGGSYEIDSITYFSYTVKISAPYYRLKTDTLTINSDSTNRDYELLPQSGILVINDPGSKEYDNKWFDKTLREVKTTDIETKSADSIYAYLIELGYDATLETASSTDPSTWSGYKLIIWSAGINTSPLSNATWRQNLIDYVSSGGKLMVEGGEVAYDMISSVGDSAFYNNVLHAYDWDSDNAGNLGVVSGMETHPIATTPNSLPSEIDITYGSYGDQDAAKITSDAYVVYAPASYPSEGGIIVYDNNASPQSCQIVNYLFNFAALSDQTIAKELLQNTVEYLLAMENPPASSISGTISCSDGGSPDGAVISIKSGGFEASDTVSTSGTYLFDNLYAGNYSITVNKHNYARLDTIIPLADSQQITNLDFVLNPVIETTFVSNDTIDIPDNNTTGIYDSIYVDGNRTITDIKVYVNIAHTYIGDLTVALIGPTGDSVVLHNRSGGSSDDIVGWYPTELTVDGPGNLDDFINTNAFGYWRLHIADHSSYDTGTLNQWQLYIQSPTGISKIMKRKTPVKPDIKLLYNKLSLGKLGMILAIPTSMSGKDIKASIVDLSGRTIDTHNFGKLESGYHRENIDISKLHRGIFFINVNIGKEPITKKFIVIR